jgi:tetratricopeptide (TPR) repeat protein
MGTVNTPGAGASGSGGSGDDATLPAADEVTRPGGQAHAGAGEDGVLEAGATVGRYRIQRLLGVGGMGVVYEAYDPELDRRIALKLLHSQSTGTSLGSSSSSTGQRRLLREAQAMAKLSHANVITVHDVGLHGSEVFVAMEFVEGDTLSRWLSRTRRTRPEILHTFVAAGRGLAAAHAVGLVHRDFKPDNVMIGADGSVRVMDFGLARAAGAPGSRDEDSGAQIETTEPQELVASSELDLALTRTGAIMGTPAYMAPEQHLGTATDARTDQFSFCVSLYEALYGVRPFKASSLAGLAAKVLDGATDPPPAGADVPAWLRAVVLRGLCVDPDERHPSMAALLDALERDPIARRKKVLTRLAGAGVLAAGVAAGTWAVVSANETCKGAEQQLVGVWDDARRSAVAERFGTSALPYAQGAHERSAAWLDEYTRAWVDMSTEACEATRDGRQSQALLDLRMACLADRLAAVDATVGVLAEADDGVIERAVQMVVDLPELSRCADAELLQAQIPPPEDPTVAAAVEELRARMARLDAMERAGQYAPALEDARVLTEDASKLDYPPVQVETALVLGRLLERTGAYPEAESVLTEAFWSANGLKHERVAAEAASLLVLVVGHHAGRHDDALDWQRQGEAAVQRLGVDGHEKAELLTNAGTVAVDRGAFDEAKKLHEQSLSLRRAVDGEDSASVGLAMQNLGAVIYRLGDYALARDTQRQALAVLENALGSGHPAIAKSRQNLGGALYSLGDLEGAEKQYLAAIEILERAVGPEHRGIGDLLNNLGLIQRKTRRFAEARATYARAIEVYEKALGPEHPRVASALNNYGNLFYTEGDYAGAREQFERALKLRLNTLGPDHPDVAYSHQNLGNAYYMEGDFERAIAEYETSLAIREKALEPDHPDIALAATNLAGVLQHEGRFEEALPHVERALAIREKTLPPTHPRLASNLTILGATLTGLGRRPEAIEALERAITILGDPPKDPVSLAETRYALARALLPSSDAGTRSRAIELAEQARAAFADDLPAMKGPLEELDAWLAEHR